LSAVTVLTAAATGCNCCDLNCFRRTAAMPIYGQCPPVAAPAATVVDPGCGQPVYSAPLVTPGAVIAQ
jgi:hypothetical protein